MTVQLNQARGQHTRLYRWMLFVDGENFAIRGRELLRSKGIEPSPGEFFVPDVLLWWPWNAVAAYPRGTRELFPPLHSVSSPATKGTSSTGITGARSPQC